MNTLKSKNKADPKRTEQVLLEGVDLFLHVCVFT